jgi:hypothetical protein
MGGFAMKTIKVRHISNDIFAGLKAIRITPDIKPDAQDSIQTYYGQLAIMQCTGAVQIGICVAKNREYVVDMFERHAKSAELLEALKGDFVTLTAPSIMKNGELCPDMDRAAAIRVNQGEGVLFDADIWHWTPYAVTPTCDVLVIFRKDTPKDDFIPYKISEPVKIEL